MSVASLCNIQGNGRLSEYFQRRRQDLLGPQQVNSGMELRKTLQNLSGMDHVQFEQSNSCCEHKKLA